MQEQATEMIILLMIFSNVVPDGNLPFIHEDSQVLYERKNKINT